MKESLPVHTHAAEKMRPLNLFILQQFVNVGCGKRAGTTRAVTIINTLSLRPKVLPACSSLTSLTSSVCLCVLLARLSELRRHEMPREC